MSIYALQTLRDLGLNERTSYSIVSQIRLSSLDAGQVVWPRGQYVDSWRFIMTGMVAFTIPTKVGGHAAIDIRGENSWIGEGLILTSQVTPFECSCVTASEFLTIPRLTLVNLMHTEVVFANEVARLMAARTNWQQEMLTLLRFGSPCLRVVQGLALFAESLNLTEPRSHRELSASLPAKQSILATLCGVSRTVMSKYLQTLQLHGWLSIEYGITKFCRLRAWSEFLDGRRKNGSLNMSPGMGEVLRELERADIRIPMAA